MRQQERQPSALRRRVSLVFGTRPEAIKLCPVVRALSESNHLAPHICVTGQHRELLDQVLAAFDVKADVDLRVMTPNQTLAALSSKLLTSIDEYLVSHAPELVLVQGDTTSTLCAAMAAFYRRIPVAHVEAGLRTGNLGSPFPEELNRVVTSRIAALHFAPSEASRDNLLREGVNPNTIWVTGNTVVDALLMAISKVSAAPVCVPGVPESILVDGRTVVLVTGHRRENIGQGFEAICLAIRELADRFRDAAFIYPVHLNPSVRQSVFRILEGVANVHLVEPLEYLPFVRLLQRSSLVLTDSGGVQEEAPALGKPVLVLRDTTERPEVVAVGAARLVGTSTQAIVSAATEILQQETIRQAMSVPASPYGDGNASGRIVAACEQFLQRE